MSDTIYSGPGATFYSDLDNAPTGLVGTVGVRIIRKSDEATVLARTTAGIVEVPAGSGRYVATLVAPLTQGDFTVFWDTGTVTPTTTATDDLVVTNNPPTGGVEPGGGTRPYSYAAAADVQTLLAGVVFTATSRPSATQVANQLAQVSDEIDSVLAPLDYQTPVPTGATVSIEMLRSWTSLGAAYKAAMAMPQGKDSKHAAEYGKEWRALLSNVESGRRQLPDAPRVASKAPRSGTPDLAAPVFNRANSRTMR
jgi:hypothetical protein